MLFVFVLFVDLRFLLIGAKIEERLNVVGCHFLCLLSGGVTGLRPLASLKHCITESVQTRGVAVTVLSLIHCFHDSFPQ